MPEKAPSGNRFRSWDSGSLRDWIEKRERMACNLMAEVDAMYRELVRRGEEPDPGEGDCRRIAQ